MEQQLFHWHVEKDMKDVAYELVSIGTFTINDLLFLKPEWVSEELFIIKEIFWPDIPQRSERKIEEDTAIAGLSDIHVGSKLFLEKSFNEFLEQNPQLRVTEIPSYNRKSKSFLIELTS